MLGISETPLPRNITGKVRLITREIKLLSAKWFGLYQAGLEYADKRVLS